MQHAIGAYGAAYPAGHIVDPMQSTRAALQADVTNLGTVIADFRVRVQAWNHPMRGVVIGMIESAAAEQRGAQAPLNLPALTPELERAVRHKLANAKRNFSAATLASQAAGGPQASGTWQTPVPSAPGGQFDAELQATGAGGDSKAILGLLALAGLGAWVWRKRRRR